MGACVFASVHACVRLRKLVHMRVCTGTEGLGKLVHIDMQMHMQMNVRMRVCVGLWVEVGGRHEEDGTISGQRC